MHQIFNLLLRPHLETSPTIYLFEISDSLTGLSFSRYFIYAEYIVQSYSAEMFKFL